MHSTSDDSLLDALKQLGKIVDETPGLARAWIARHGILVEHTCGDLKVSTVIEWPVFQTRCPLDIIQAKLDDLAAQMERARGL